MNERRPARGFDAVETWVFDLDNTLPASPQSLATGRRPHP
jgi:hypothetical protein